MENSDNVIRILLVDDNEDYCILFRELIKEITHTSYHLEWANSYETAIPIIKQKRFHAYLFAYNLGNRNGIDLLIEAIKLDKKTPIIMLTGMRDLRIDNQAMKFGATDYLNKRHLKPEIFERTIRYAIQNKRLLNDRDLLLQEINHRIKNNLQLIASIMQLEADNLQDNKAAKVLEDCRFRLNSIALLQEKLFISDNLLEMDATAYIEEIVEDLFKSILPPHKQIKYKLNSQKIKINSKQLIHCGIIVNELVSNALKYAFPAKGEREPLITVTLTQEEDRYIQIEVSDNGVGISPGYDPRITDSLGLRLVTILTEEQLRGSFHFHQDNGSRFIIRFEKE